MVDPDEVANRPADPFVRSRSGADARGVVSLTGLLGDSDRAGCRRLYLTTALDYFVEFRSAEVVAVDDVPPEAPPFLGLDATRVTLIPDATLDWVRRAVGMASDPFVLEVADRKVQAEIPDTWQAACPGVTHHFGESDFDPCTRVPGTGGGTFGPFPTQAGHTCATCDQNTCATCDQGTCLTCGRGTCATCGRNTCVTCGQGTCATCGRITCDPGCVPTAATCASCAGTCDRTCATCWETCAGTCVSCRGTCDATCANTCADTCANTCWATCWATCETCSTCAFATCDCRVSDPAWCPIRA